MTKEWKDKKYIHVFELSLAQKSETEIRLKSSGELVKICFNFYRKGDHWCFTVIPSTHQIKLWQKIKCERRVVHLSKPFA